MITGACLLLGCGGTPPAGRTEAATKTSAAVPTVPTVASAPPASPRPVHPVTMFECSLAVCETQKVVATFEQPTWELSLVNTTRNGPVESLPTVVRGPSSMGMVLDFTTTPEETYTLGWAAAILLEDKQTIVGVLDNAVESGGEELIVVTSTNAGETWRRRATILKPHYMAFVREVKAESKTHWTITLDLPDCAGCRPPTGEYRSTTRDGGASFTPFTLQ